MPKLTFECTHCYSDIVVWQDDAPGLVIADEQTIVCPRCEKFVAQITNGRKVLEVRVD